ncbi:hypothetical protein K505DRAFT_365325 [Melanomma pulvis-pyrius CBS 109.77]|uniref:Uncharacterized protein n=1 Tax=Melanomma pulvis-pyrius CBS 109.77 TaxID=1314802 RepID=A0A6A6X0Q8_9PLEO|nr:hypothetical protein K505DRAFT_365325 [Melanomma pulvis-pyrius CBS 109.77]
MLLEYVANVDGIHTTLSNANTSPAPSVHADFPEQTPLMYAIAANEPAVASLLIKHGADVNRGFISPLSIALRQDIRTEEDHGLVNLLIKKGSRTRGYDVLWESELDDTLGMHGSMNDLDCPECDMYKVSVQNMRD